MALPGFSVHDPKFEIDIADQEVGLGIQELVKSVEYESADGMADILRVILQNPTSRQKPQGILTDLKMFQPGNEISVRMGYGLVEHIGRGVLIAQSPNFAQSGFPTIQLTAYSKDHEMMKNAPEEGKKRIYQKPAEIGDILETVAGRYSFEVDAPEAFELGRTLTQKAGVSDFDFITGLANMAGAAFWVDADADGVWTLHWRLPDDKSRLPDQQDKERTFTYGVENATLFAFKPEFAIRESVTKLKVIVRNPQKGKTFIEEFEEDASEHPDVAAAGDPEEDVDAPVATGGSAKLFFGKFSFDIVPNKKFKTAAEVKKWAEQWFRRNRENFVTGRGKTIGIPDLRARQVHILEGIGTTYSGPYYFARVKHKMSDSEGYVCDFSARKVLP